LFSFLNLGFSSPASDADAVSGSGAHVSKSGSVMHDGMVHHYTCDPGPDSVRSAWSHFNLVVGGRHQGRYQVVHGGVADGTHVRGRCDALQEERTGVEMVRPKCGYF